MVDSIDWTDTTPLRLKRAAEVAFPDGGMTASGLRREAVRGRLVVERIAGKDYTTLQAIADMRKLCRVAKNSSARPANPLLPNSLGLTEANLAHSALTDAREELRRIAVAKRPK